jgi:hypothetical protein
MNGLQLKVRHSRDFDQLDMMAKPRAEQVEFHETIQKGLDPGQDALYQAYISKGPEWHQNMTRRLLRKVDLHLLPFLIVMYLLNFLDRK